MTHWGIHAGELRERETDFDADFTCTNRDTGKQVTITLKQMKGDPASDLIGACTALAQLLTRASRGEDLQSDPDTGVGRLN